MHGGDLQVFKQEDQPFPRSARRTDITVKSLDNLTKPVCDFDTTISNKTADSSNRQKTIKLTDKNHTDCCPQMNASYVPDNYLYRVSSLSKNRLYAKARKENYDIGDRSSISPTICRAFLQFSSFIFETNGQQEIQTFFGYEKKIRLAYWLKAQWVNETCRATS